MPVSRRAPLLRLSGHPVRTRRPRCGQCTPVRRHRRRRAADAARSSSTHVVRVDLPQGGDDPYVDAASTLQRWLADGVLACDVASLYLYRMTFVDEDVTSPARPWCHRRARSRGCRVPVDALPHEHTNGRRPRAIGSTCCVATTTAPLAVWGLSLAGGLSKLLDPRHRHGASAAWLCRRRRGTRALAADRRERPSTLIIDAVSSSPVAIADGHHRYETCLSCSPERPDLPD